MSASSNTQKASTYVTSVTVFNSIAFVSGQLPRKDGEIKFFGKVGDEVDLLAAQEAAALCANACLLVLDNALGDRGRIAQVLKLTGFVASAPDFTKQGQVIDAASKVLVDALGAAGHHSRSAIGVQQLPHGATVEVELIVGLK
jgi:enamine deaminase RidA (YjgF/YER057c/UK114 family)